MNLSKNALEILEKRYLKKDENGKVIETPLDMFKRVANNIAQADLNYEESKDKVEETEREFLDVMTNLYFLPNSPTLMNAGRELQELAACYVIGVPDDMGGIFEAIKTQALITKGGGGTGFNFSNLRPENDFVKSSNGISSGPISFMSAFDFSTNIIKQGGVRRGANMGLLSISHPDIEKFISCKSDLTKFTNFNISVIITDEFIDAVKENEDFNLINPRNGKITKTVKAKYLFDKIAEEAWKTGEPGIVFIDRINKYNTVPFMPLNCTNPCGEQPLHAVFTKEGKTYGEACNLGSINLSKMVIRKDDKYIIDYELLQKTVNTAVHFLDNVIDISKYPLPEIDDLVKQNRKIGLGVMGFADLLFKLKVSYKTKEACKIAKSIMSFISEKADEMSISLGKIRGTFPNWSKSIYSKTNKTFRNATRTTIAPTGTLSTIANCSSGIEPVYSIAYFREVMGTSMIEKNDVFVTLMKERKLDPDILIKIEKKDGTESIKVDIPDDYKKIFITAHDIPPEWHLKIQSAFQEYVNNATSKTLNLPNSATIEDIKNIYNMAFNDEIIKGISVYRNGCRSGVLLTEKKIENKTPIERQDVMNGKSYKVKTGCGNMYVVINSDTKMREVFATMGKTGGCVTAQLEAIGRLISLALRSGINPKDIIRQLKEIRCPNPSTKMPKILSCADAIAKKIEENLKSLGEAISVDFEKTSTVIAGVCPECGHELVREEGCVKCRNCFYSKCS